MANNDTTFIGAFDNEFVESKMNETFMSAFDRAFIEYTRLIMLRVLCRFGFHPVFEKTKIDPSNSAAFIDACLYLNDLIDEKEQDVRFKFKKAYNKELPDDSLEMVKVIDEVHGPNAPNYKHNEYDLNERMAEFEDFLRGGEKDD